VEDIEFVGNSKRLITKCCDWKEKLVEHVHT
jgi:hypothetical protein